MTKDIIIIGAGGTSIDIVDTIFFINKQSVKPVYNIVGFLDDDPQKWKKEIVPGIRILGPVSMAREYPSTTRYVYSIGSVRNIRNRKSLFLDTQIDFHSLESIIHPSATISMLSNIGNGSIVFQNVTIGSNVEIGECVVILPNTVVSHDSKVGAYSLICSNVCINGGVDVGERCFIGSGANLRNNIKVEKESIIGMGANVIKDVFSLSVMIGNPAVQLQNNG